MYSSVTEGPSDQQSSSVPDSTAASIFSGCSSSLYGCRWCKFNLPKGECHRWNCWTGNQSKTDWSNSRKVCFWKCCRESYYGRRKHSLGRRKEAHFNDFDSLSKRCREEELSIIDDLYKLRAHFFSQCGIDSDTRVNTNECGLDSIAVIRELVSSLISRADGIRTSLSTLEESDVVERGRPRVWKSPHCLCR